MNEALSPVRARLDTRPAGQRILIVVTFVNVAGAQIAALRLARGLKDRGFEPSVVFLYRQVEIPDPTFPYEVLAPRDNPGPADYLRMLVGLMRLMRRLKPQTVLTFLPLAHAFGQFCATLLGVKRRIAAHRMPIDTAQRPLKIIDWIYAWTGVYTQATAVSKSVLASCSTYPSRMLKKLPVIYNGLFEWTPSSLTQQEARRRFGLPEQGVLMVTVGRFVAQKNYPLLVQVIAQLEGVTCVIAGDGPLRGQIEADIAARNIDAKVIRLGNLSRAEVPHLIQAGDLFVQTSTYEGNSNSMIEALTSGAVIVAHDVPEQREVLEDDAGRLAGRLVPLNDVAAWVATVSELIEKPALRAQISEMARARAPIFKYEKMIDSYERLLT